MRKNSKGFSLIELLIVVAIMLVIAAIAIPNLLRAKMASTQSSAISDLRTISSAEATYRANKTPNQYDTLTNLAADGELDSVWVTAAMSATGHNGYVISQLVAPTTDNFGFVALPVTWNKSGKNGYCVTEVGTIHVIDGSTAAPTAPADEPSCNALPILGQ